MAHKYILDTHALVWYLEGNPTLSSKARQAMQAKESELVLPFIALAEATFLIERQRIAIPTVTDLLNDIQADKRIEVYPLDWQIFERSLTEQGKQIPELHDRFIVSTGLHLQDLGHTVNIITKDQNITNAKVLTVLW